MATNYRLGPLPWSRDTLIMATRTSAIVDESGRKWTLTENFSYLPACYYEPDIISVVERYCCAISSGEFHKKAQKRIFDTAEIILLGEILTDSDGWMILEANRFEDCLRLLL